MMMNNKQLTPVSSINGIDWPALPSPAAAAVLALQYHFEQSQWWPPETMLEHQFRQLTRHDRAVRTASNWQVRQPLYKSSKERWINYKPFLGPLAGLTQNHA